MAARSVEYDGQTCTLNGLHVIVRGCVSSEQQSLRPRGRGMLSWTPRNRSRSPKTWWRAKLQQISKTELDIKDERDEIDNRLQDANATLVGIREQVSDAKDDIAAQIQNKKSQKLPWAACSELLDESREAGKNAEFRERLRHCNPYIHDMRELKNGQRPSQRNTPMNWAYGPQVIEQFVLQSMSARSRNSSLALRARQQMRRRLRVDWRSRHTRMRQKMSNGSWARLERDVTPLRLKRSRNGKRPVEARN